MPACAERSCFKIHFNKDPLHYKNFNFLVADLRLVQHIQKLLIQHCTDCAASKSEPKYMLTVRIFFPHTTRYALYCHTTFNSRSLIALIAKHILVASSRLIKRPSFLECACLEKWFDNAVPLNLHKEHSL
jgi:hypothetical protein